MESLRETDVIVIGGGPGGATAAALLVRQGWRVRLFERERFPRFQIGESLLPYNNDIFDRLGFSETLESAGFHPKYGAEFVTGDGGVSHRFRFGRTLPERYARSWQVTRSRFDDLLLRHAASSGVDVREESMVTEVKRHDPERVEVRVRGAEGEETHAARFVIDATGSRTLLGSNRKREREDLRKISFFAHYSGVEPSAEGRDAGNTVIVVLRNAWFWLIPLADGVTSVGLVVDRDAFREAGLTPAEMLEETIAATPYVASRMREAERVTEVYARKDFSYGVDKVAGENFALVGDAAGFLDPIFSTGVYMSMRSAEMVADAVDERLRHGSSRGLRRYEKSWHRGLRRYAAFIGNFYRREFLEMFLQPAPKFGIFPVIIAVLAGNVFDDLGSRWKLALFFLLVRIQGWRRNLAPPIAWDKLPTVATSRR